MKKVLFIIMLLPIMAWSQPKEIVGGSGTIITVYHGTPEYERHFNKSVTIFTEWQKYLDDCNELVADTVSQSGTVKCELVPIKTNGKIVSYNTVPIDTVWNKCDCEKYKYETIYSYSGINWTSGNGITLTSTNSWVAEPEPAKNVFSIKRNKICMIKKRKASFDDFFERWCVEKKLIEMN